MKYSIFILSLLFLTSSCNFIAKKAFGIEILEEFNQNKIDTFYNSFNFEGLTIDKKLIGLEYLDTLKQEIELDSLDKKNLYQTIQFFIMDSEKILYCMYACQARPKGKELLWNENGCLDYFPPKCTSENHEIQYQFVQEQFVDINVTKKYHIVYIWTNMLPNQSKQTLNLLLEKIDNADLRSDTHITLVNTDKMFIDLNTN